MHLSQDIQLVKLCLWIARSKPFYFHNKINLSILRSNMKTNEVNKSNNKYTH